MYLEHYDSRYDPPAPLVKVQIASYIEGTEPLTISAFLDTGSDGTMFPLRVLEMVQAEYQESKYLRGITGQREKVDIYLVSVTIGPYTVHGVRAAGIKGRQREALIGRDVLASLVVTFNGLGETTTLTD